MTATITRPDGGQRIVTTDTSKNVILTDRDALNRTTRYKYDSYGRLTHVVSPEGAVDGGGNPVSGYTRYTYDARGNVTEVRQVSKTPGTPADLVTLAGYDTSCTYVAKCNKPNWTRDAKGAQTDYLYDNTTGNLLSVTAPAPSGTARPVTVYGYANRQAYYKNGAGSIVASGQDISLPAQISTCQTAGVTTPTTALPCSGGGDEVRTIIDYGPQIAGIANNLLPVSVTQRNGTGTLSVTTATAYDAIGNVLTVDGPLAGTAVPRAIATMRRDNWSASSVRIRTGSAHVCRARSASPTMAAGRSPPPRWAPWPTSRMPPGARSARRSRA